MGPFYAIGLCRSRDNELAPDGVELAGTLFDGRGEPVPDGMVEIWDAERRLWGRCGTEPDGEFSFRVPEETPQVIVFLSVAPPAAGETKTKEKKQPGTDLVIRDLYNGAQTTVPDVRP